MIELPEAISLSGKANGILKGKTINEVLGATRPHKFAFFNGDPLKYGDLLSGKKVEAVMANGGFVDIILSGDTCLSLSDGVIMKLGDVNSKIPEKYQMLITFGDETYIVFTVAMYGSIFAFKGELDNTYHKRAVEVISPLEDAFDEALLKKKAANDRQNISVKAFLATGQRIPGLGNDVLQDILFNAGLNPKLRLSSLSDKDISALFKSLKSTLGQMTRQGGRDTESDFFGNKGGYKTILSKNTYKEPCPVCGAKIVKEAYMGGTVYYCPVCQPLK